MADVVGAVVLLVVAAAIVFVVVAAVVAAVVLVVAADAVVVVVVVIAGVDWCAAIEDVAVCFLVGTRHRLMSLNIPGPGSASPLASEDLASPLPPSPFQVLAITS